ncbi:ATP-binding protein [Sporosarcina jeotgali]|uniref:ATP-binding protein n=1 Tax=Sporosarcina jeotgali TaxID=3020056 RepID=A0ABZ0KX99_9BACL|nr:ATP-binding protein [Sporosarcina sp. B2O-1]WOV85026.1 ATP-binding protein [Sporosarcina sp. B2O-1]
MSQLTSAHIKYYRGLQDIDIKELTAVNIFVGENNSGKTSILEAIQLMSNPLSLREFRSVSRMRERFFVGHRYTSSEELISWMFSLNRDKQRENICLAFELDSNYFNLKYSLHEEEYIVIGTDNLSTDTNEVQEDTYYREDTVKQLTIDVEVKKNQKEAITEKYIFNEFKPQEFQLLEQRKEIFSSSFISAMDHRIQPLSPLLVNELIKSGDRPKFIEALQQFDPQISGIELLMDTTSRRKSAPVPYIQHETLGLVPVSIFGDGLRKALLIASRIVRSENSVLLIDELETGIHTKLLPTFFKWVIQMCKDYNVQIIATTHSLEALDGMLQANSNDVNRLTVYRLESDEEKTKIRHFTGDQLKKLRYTLGQDVR